MDIGSQLIQHGRETQVFCKGENKQGDAAPLPRKHLFFVDGMLAILIILVILGHCMMPGYPSWYFGLHTWIYSFHMAVFFFISGLLVGYTCPVQCSWKEIWMYLGRRLWKFGLPFVLLGLPLCVVIVISRGGDTTAVLQSSLRLFLDTMASPVIYLWFVVVLMEFYILTVLLLRINQWTIPLALAISLWLYYHPLPRLLCLHAFSNHLLFFLLGLLVSQHFEQLKKIPVWFLTPSVFLFLFHTFRPLAEPMRLVVQISAICMFVLLGYILAKCSFIQPYCSILARCCYEIYLFQMVFLHLLWHFLGWFPMAGTIRFIVFLALSLPCAILPSIAIAHNRVYRQIIGNKREAKCA